MMIHPKHFIIAGLPQIQAAARTLFFGGAFKDTPTSSAYRCAVKNTPIVYMSYKSVNTKLFS